MAQIGQAFSDDIIQAATRVNYASNLEFIHALDAMVSMAPDDAVQIVGGNWQIFSIMVNRSGAALHLGTTVTSMHLKSEGGDEEAPKYFLRTEAPASAAEDFPVAFDDVVVATPWQFSRMKAGHNTLQHTIDKIPYVTLHVTLFASPHRLSPEYFGLAPDGKAPTTVLTTLSPEEAAQPGSAGAGKPGFYSTSTLSNVTNPKTNQDEYMYKIFSPETLTPGFLSRLLGADVPESFTGPAGPDSPEAISWYYPHVFQSYPVAYPRATFQDPVVGRGIYYTSGMESLISCMETNALMGKNVARLIVDDVLGKSRVDADPAQKVVGGGETPMSDMSGMGMGEL
jgi:prenylcysteine oxidase / farnesylcysteine lyase